MEEIITLGGGCFWCIEAVFVDLKGVIEVQSGYSGGEKENPTYDQVCSGTTGHAEVIQVTFDPAIISLHDILTVFFTLHDPTTPNRQGSDIGEQYRSIVFYRNEEQRETTEKVMEEIENQGIWEDHLVTIVEPFKKFYLAEDYHQDYYRKNGSQPYCQIVIAPKVAKLRKLYQEKLA